MLRLGLGTMVALALCAGTLMLGRRWLRGIVVPGEPGDELRVLETVAIGNRCFVHLLQAGEGQVLAGTDSAGLKALMAVPRPFEHVLDDRLVGPRDDAKVAVPDQLLTS